MKMNEDTHEIRAMEDIPLEERKRWTPPFSVGDTVDIMGIPMRIKRVKIQRQELVLERITPRRT